MVFRPPSDFGRPTSRRSSGRMRPGRASGRAGRRRRSGYSDLDLVDPFDPMAALQPYSGRRREPRAGRVMAAGVRGYARWVARSPDTRGLGTGLAALYPLGEVAHRYATGPWDPFMLGAFAPPAALAAWVASYKAHGSPRYAGAVAAIVAALPVWLATAAMTGITNLPTLLAYTAASAATWSAYTWSDVLKMRRRFAQIQARWETIAGLAGLEGSRLLRTDTTRIGVRFKVDLGVDGPPVAQLQRGGLAEKIARCYGIATGQVRIDDGDGKNARIMWITVQLIDLWANLVHHPAVTVTRQASADGVPAVQLLDPSEITADTLTAAGAGKGHRSVMDGPFVIGTDPETGEDLEVTVFDAGGARHVDVVATNGGAKSNVLSNIVQQGAECYDVLVVAIDLGKGVVPSLWKQHLHAGAGIGEENKALAILDWIDALVAERALACQGGTHKPTAKAPIVILIVDEQDTATGFESQIAAAAKPVLEEVYKRGRSGGVVLVTAKQRDVVQHTGSKEGKANVTTTIVGRVTNTSEMKKAVPDWEQIGCPDMSTYGGNTEGVVLLLRKGGTWQAGRSRALFDPATVTALAAAYGPSDAALEPAIAERLPGYTDTLTHTPAKARTSSSTGASNASSGPVPDAPATPAADGGNSNADTGGGHGPADTGGDSRRPSPGPAGWEFDTTDEQQIDKAAKGLVEQVDEYIKETVQPPEKGVSLDELNATKQRLANTSVPADIAQAVIDFLASRGSRGARRDELIRHLDIPRSTASDYLGKMSGDKIVSRAGKGKASRYYLPAHNPYDPTNDDAA